MKTLTLAIIFLVSFMISKAQTKLPPSPLPLVNIVDDQAKIFDSVEVEARFPGGDEGWKKYLIANFDVDKVTKKMPSKKKSYNETAIVKFIVKKDGTLTDIDVENNVHPALKKEAIRLIQESPKWIPAVQNGKKVNAYRRQPITIAITVE